MNNSKSKKEKVSSIFPLPMRSPKQVGNAIKRLRRYKKLSQVQLAQKAGLTQATISRIEKGHTKAEVDTLFLILAALDADMVVTERQKIDVNDLEGLF